MLLALSLLLVVKGSPTFQSLPIPSAQTEIVGGQEATPHQFPWQISLQYEDIPPLPHYYHTCGATVVDELHIVCAAHCVVDRKESRFRVVAGAHNIHALLPESSQQKRHVTAMWHHEAYDPNIITNDVSVLKLDEPLEFNEYVQPIPMADQGVEPEGGVLCLNSGWGSTSHNNFPSMPNKLQYVELPIVDRDTCSEWYQGINGIDQGMVCAGKAEGVVGPCSGDSGGPLVCPYPASNSTQEGTFYLAGVVSWGMIPCGQQNYPGVFSNVAHFREWLDQHIAM
jgi:secreted trypsin-like serine protease